MLGIIVSAITFGILTLFVMPVFNIGFVGLYITIGLSFVPLTLFADFKKANTEKSYLPRTTVLVMGMVAVAFALTWLNSSEMLHASRYRALLGTVHNGDRAGGFNKGLPPIDVRHAPLVSIQMANQAAQKKLSEVPGMGSQFHLGPFVKQKVGNQLVWVSFLEYTDGFKWFGNDGTPGYVRVSATNPEDVQLVTNLNGQALHMRYLDSAWFGQNAERKIYFSAPTIGMTDMTPELDDAGRPYLVATLYDNKIGFGGRDATGTAILDVQTGEVKQYDIAHTPAWVDRIQPAGYIQSQIADWGEYVHGYFNPSDKDRLAPVGNIDLVYGTDGRCYFYQALTSVGRDNGIIGFLLVDTRTKAVKEYRMAGANEATAQAAATGAIAEKKYTATNALPFSVNGQPTYVMTLTDGTGIARAYGMVNVKDYQVVAVSDTLASTLRDYLNRLSEKQGSLAPNAKVLDKAVNGVVQRIATDVHRGNTIYYVTLDEDRCHIFTANSDLSEKLVLTHPGDHIRIKYQEGTSKLVNLTAFDNADLHTHP